jgi:hypothetical protein
MAWFRRFVILSHRYLGIALSLIFVVWFASGITMMWWGGMPRLTADERLDRLPALDLRTVGVFTLTWVFSGLLSMEPFGWATNPGLQIPRDAFTGGTVELSRFPPMDPAKWEALMEGRAIKEVEFVRIQDDPYYVVRTARESSQPASFERLHQPYNVTGRRQGQRLIVAAGSLSVRPGPFSVDSLVARLKKAAPQAPILEIPILRVKFADPDRTWVYVDPEMSQVVARIHRLDRVERWLYNGLHSLDFSFWYNRRPLWDIGVLTLMLGGLASSTIGCYLGIRRLRRSAKQTAKSLADAPAYARARSAGL